MTAPAVPTLPAAVQPLLQTYVARLQAGLPGRIAGVYLHGSIAWGVFAPGASDVDALVLLTLECGPDELAFLRSLHADLRAAFPATRLEASYVLWADRGRYRDAPPHPYHHAGAFHERGIFDFNSPRWASILWWQIAHRGLALAGPPPAALGIEIGADTLVADSRRLVETFWLDWTRSRAQLSGLRHTSHVDWVVFGILRTWYTLREGDVTSKPGAAAYGLAHLPPRWHRLIRETAELRASGREPALVIRLRRAVEAALFMRYMVAECRRAAGAARV